MMNDLAIENIHRILQNEIIRGNIVVGIISLNKAGEFLISWRTDDQGRAAVFAEQTQG